MVTVKQAKKPLAARRCPENYSDGAIARYRKTRH
jgi:hypothetical protein